ncbi:MAG: cation-translocating P-type ATPase [Candidatus Pacearchaeota archaeon]
MQYKWHSLDVDQIINILKSDREKGLTSIEAERRLKEQGKNIIIEKKINPFKIYLSQFTSPLILILIFALIILIFLKFWIDSIIILAVILINTILSFVNEYRSEKIIAELKKEMPFYAKVIRDGKLIKIPSSDVVLGDIIILEHGDKVPADARVIESFELRTDDSIITGESSPQAKFSRKLKEDISLLDMDNIVWQSTKVVYGRGKAIVIARGMESEYGKIAKVIEEKLTPTPLQQQLKKLAKILGIFVIFIAVLFFILGILYGIDKIQTFLTAVSLAVAAVPEGLPTVVTIGLSLGILKLKKSNLLVKKLFAAEGLGSVTAICIDKTGTITKGEMVVRKIFVDDKIFDVSGIGFSDEGEISYCGIKIEKEEIEKNQALLFLLKNCYYCNNADIKNLIGDPTELALAFLVKKSKLDFYGKRLDEISFSSERKMMTVMIEEKNKVYIFSKGAPEKILDLCNKKLTKVGEKYEEKILRENEKNKILKIYEEFAKKGYRVLAFAYKKGIKNTRIIENNFIFLGLVAIYDAPKENVKEVIKKANEFGIKFYMLTGDSTHTAKAIAEEIGLEGKVMEGKEIDKISEEELANIIDEYRIFTRLSVENKIKIIKALHKKGEIVAMFGDGLNDAPALKKSDIGVSMNKATDVTKETAEIIILDDDLGRLVDGVIEGRKIRKNIEKVINYLLSCNLAEVIVVFTGILFKRIILFPIQILWINLITDSLPSIAFANDPIDAKKIKEIKKEIIDKKLIYKIILNSLVLAFFILLIYFIGLKYYNLEIATTMAFLSIAIFEFARITAIKIDENLFNNKWLNITLLICIILQLIIIYTPINKIFRVSYLPLSTLLIIIGTMIIMVLTMYLVAKFIEKRL